MNKMASLLQGITSVCNAFSKTTSILGTGFQQVRHKYINRWMIRDLKRRNLVKEYGVERMRLLALKRNTILPNELQEIVSKEFDERIPRQTAMRQLTFRCVLTSRPRGVVRRFRLSRIVFRDLADYNKLAGVQRALW